ncbi:MAG: ACT domain-containing protein [Candidatus Aminicenantales bacterium]
MHKVEEATELHVITPNEPGVLGRVLGTLANAAVNLTALCAYSQEDKGHFFLITADNKRAEKCLKAVGYKVKTNKVVTAEISDRIGAGAEIGALLGNAVIDVQHCYGTSAGVGRALLVLKTNHPKKTLETLK